MEENSAVLECLILFYIDMKHKLKTKQLNKKKFMTQMLKHCRENGFKKYSEEEMRNAWEKLLSKYVDLKNKSTVEARETWKYFEILDSCYEESDFDSDKFSQEMAWLLIECYLKSISIKGPQKLNTIIAEIHKEFVQCGYFHINKRDIINKWRCINFEYDKWKYDQEKLNKFPYLQALNGFYEQNRKHIVNMIFNRELTEILISYFTDKKITCIIHGYNSDQVLKEIQSRFKDLGFFFTKENIREKWEKLTNVYRYLTSRGRNKSNWVHFDSMKNHFMDNFSVPISRSNNEVQGHERTTRRLRPRSKSVGAELCRKEPVSPKKNSINKNKPVKRPVQDPGKLVSGKKIKTGDSASENIGNPRVILEKISQSDKNRLSDNNDVKNCTLQSDLNINRSFFEGTEQSKSEKNVTGSKSQVHIINIDQSDIDEKSGNLTINIPPSIADQFSDKALPLKKRLLVNGDSIEKQLNEAKDETHEICNGKTTIGESKKELTDYRINNLGNYQDPYNFSQQCLNVPETQSLPLQKYSGSNCTSQSPVFLLVVKVDGVSNKDQIPSSVDLKLDRHLKPEEKTDKEGEELSTATTFATEFAKPVSSKGKMLILGKRKGSKHFSVPNSVPTESFHNKITDLCDNPRSDFSSTSNNRTAIHHANLTDRIGTERYDIGTVDNVGEQITSEENRIEDKPCQMQSMFREPLPFVEKTDSSVKSRNLSTKLELSKSNVFLHSAKHQVGAAIPEKYVKNDFSRNVSDTNASAKRTLPGFKYISQVIKPAASESVVDSCTLLAQPSKNGSTYLGKTEDFENESVFSEAVGEDDGLKDNLLATVIDFQEQNNQEFIEIKNLMKQNNLLQRETNRLLRLLLEKK